MKSFLLSALALAAATGTALANGNENDKDWYTLDREIEKLSTSFTAQGPASATVSAWIKTAYRSSSDITTLSGNDLGGFSFNGLRILVDGQVGEAEFRISIDGADGVNGTGGATVLKDAYAHVPLGWGIGLRAGQMKSEIMFTSIADRDKLILYERSYLGTIFNDRDAGAQLYGSWGWFDGYLGFFNGDDEQGDELLVNAKGVITFGSGLVRGQSGGYGTGASTRFSLGIGGVSDPNVDEADAFTAELVGVSGPFWFGGELADFNSGFTGVPTAGNLMTAGTTTPSVADTSPWGFTLGLMINAKNEFAIRYDNTDNALDDKQVTGGYTYYAQGHAMKFQVNYMNIDSAATDTSIFLVGWTAAI